MRKGSALFLAAALGLAASSAEAGERPRIAVAFAGGGARGGAHVGVLKVLEELRIPVDFVAGTSIGSIVAALYATGMSPAEMEDVLSKTDWDDALQDDQARPAQPFRQKQDDFVYPIKTELGFNRRRLVLPGGLVSGQKLGYLLRRLTLPACEISDFDRLPIPFRAVATDIVSGDRVVLGKGDIAHAVRASMALPGVFSPVELDGRLLTDGGVVDNLPIDVARDMGADVVIAIDISTLLRKRENLKTFLSIANQTTGFQTRLNVLAQIATLTPKDFLISPDLEGISTLDFREFPRAVERGEKAARAVREELRRFSVSEEEYAAFLKRQRVPRTATRVDEVRLEPLPGVDPRPYEGRITSAPGPLDLAVVEKDLARLYALGDFTTVDFTLAHEGGRSVLIFRGNARPPAPDRFRLGLKLDTDFAADSSFGLRFGIYKTRLNSLRGEVRAKGEVGLVNGLSLELYQPTDYRARFFVSPTIGISRSPIDAFLGDLRIARILGTRLLAELDAGVSLGALGEVRAGLVRGRGNFRTEIFTSDVPVSTTEDVAGIDFRAALDQLGSSTFPRSGWGGAADLLLARHAAGGEHTYNRLKVGATYARTFGETTFLPAVSLDLKVGAHDRPYFDDAAAGGFLNLSGLKPSQLTGENAGVARLVAYQRLSRLNSFLGTGIYLGGSIETGNAWQDSVELSDLRLAFSLFLAADTALGPLYVGYGHADRGQGSFYLALGFPLD